MRVNSKSQLLQSINETWATLWDWVEKFDGSQRETRLIFDSIEHWSVKDILGHLHGWHQLLLTWAAAGKDGTVDLPATGFKWNQTVDLNQTIFDQHKHEKLASVARNLKASHGRILKFTESLTDAELLVAGNFSWTGKNALASYVAPNTTSHYKWATQKLKRLIKLLPADSE